MIRLLTAAAVAVLLATPVMAQSVSPSERPDPSLQNQAPPSSPGSSPSGSMSTSPGLSNQAPADCLPNDPRPACQTAQLPGQEPGSSSGTTGSQIERQESMPPSGSGSSGSSGPSGSMGR